MMEVMKLVLYAGLCTCFLSLELMAVRGKLLENPPCTPSEVQMDNTCEVCARPEQSGVCHPGYKCSDVAADNAAFSCYYTRLKGWENFSNQYDITVYKQANQSSPLPLISTIFLYQRNQTNSVYGYPALNVKVDVPYMLFGPGEQNEVPKSLRMVFSSVEDAECRDSYYYKQHITRFYRFSSYSPTSSDLLKPQQVQFKCLTGLDVCGKVRVYNVQLTSYTAPSTGSLYIEQNFTVTAFMDESKWFPVIATAVLPNNSVYVVFNPRSWTGVTHEIYLENKDGHRKTDVHNFPKSVEKYVCVFDNVEPGTYRAQLLVKYTKHQTEPVARYQSAPLVIPGETGDKVSQEPPVTNQGLVLPILVIVSFVIASILLVLLYWQRKNNLFKLICQWSRNHQESKNKVFLLYPREAEKFVPCITDFLKKKLVVVSEKDWKIGQSCPLDLFRTDIKLCSHLLVLWSPSASGLVSGLNNHRSIEINPRFTVQDYFREAVTFSKDLSICGNLEIVVLCIPGYGEMTISENIGEQKTFNLTRDCKKLLKYLTDDRSDLNDVAENALDREIMRIMNLPHEEDQVKVVDDDCPTPSQPLLNEQMERNMNPPQEGDHVIVVDDESQDIDGSNNSYMPTKHDTDLFNFNTDHNEPDNFSGHHNNPGNFSSHHISAGRFEYHHMPDNNLSGQCTPACHCNHYMPDNISNGQCKLARHCNHYMPNNSSNGQHIPTTNCNDQLMATDYCHVGTELDPPPNKPLLSEELDQGYHTTKSSDLQGKFYILCNDQSL
ncbi:uncharacterized protein LOC117330546 [Pecten maximus]|uniref:uncharacterized protein LOC117330546 n=1 Tax=Pecten maximus TaxID=6579 RepID=UPI001457EFE3|nr:uncharacterized protein LOC117330546 [Pecten maximus]